MLIGCDSIAEKISFEVIYIMKEISSNNIGAKDFKLSISFQFLEIKKMNILTIAEMA